MHKLYLWFVVQFFKLINTFWLLLRISRSQTIKSVSGCEAEREKTHKRIFISNWESTWSVEKQFRLVCSEGVVHRCDELLGLKAMNKITFSLFIVCPFYIILPVMRKQFSIFRFWSFHHKIVTRILLLIYILTSSVLDRQNDC